MRESDVLNSVERIMELFVIDFGVPNPIDLIDVNIQVIKYGEGILFLGNRYAGGVDPLNTVV